MSCRPRVVVPEILDGLPHDDPDAIASRRDLRRVNAVMGNPRWIFRQVREHAAIARRGITEIGAGDGGLASRMARAFPDTRVTAIDLAPAPDGALPANLEWRQGDLFESVEAHPQGGLLVACLILHHFETPELQRLGREFLPRFDALAIVEPDRRPLAHFLGRLAWPFINRVTRHDMHVSIDAGFAGGELAAILGLHPQVWRIQETRTLTGARRFFATKIVA
jgi:hypothetical protein